MSGVFRDVTIIWNGERVSVTPSLRLLRSIEADGISLTDIAIRTTQGKPPVSHLAVVIAQMLKAGGVSVTEEDVYKELMTGEPEQIMGLIDAVLTAFSPAEEDPKKTEPSVQNSSQTRKAKPRK